MGTDKEQTAEAAAGVPAESAPEPADGTPPAPSVPKAAISGAMWIGIGFGAMYIVRLGSSMILTRLLVPEVYALLDVAMVFIQGIHMFADVGIGTSIVQSKRGDDPDFLNTAWTLQVVRGLALWTLVLLITWPVAVFYEQPVLVLLMPIIGTTAIFDGFSSTALFLLRRRLMRGRIVALEVGCTVIGLCVTLSWVYWVAPTVWALVAGGLTGSLVSLAVSHVILPGHRCRFRWSRPAVHELVHFGRWIYLSTIITFLAFQADRLLIPKVSGFQVMGVYGRALALPNIATGLMSAFCVQLVFPIYSRMHHEGRDIRQSFAKVQVRASGFAALLVTGMLACGPAAVRCLYGQAYHEAGWMVQFLAVGCWFQMLEGVFGASLLALGRPGSMMVSNTFRLIGVLVFVPLGYLLGERLDPTAMRYRELAEVAASTIGLAGSPVEHAPLLACAGLFPESAWTGRFIGMLVGFILADFVRYLVVLWVARRNGLSAAAPDIIASLLIVVISPAAFLGGAYLAGLCNTELLHPPVHAFVQSFRDKPVRAERVAQFIQELVLLFFQGILVLASWGGLFLLWSRRK
jgi:O-antigen/teichoic acid export membrane protein